MSGPTAQPLVVELADTRGPTRVVRVSGSASMDSGSELRDRLVSLTDASTRRLVLDLADLEFINSLGLGGIVAAHLRLRSKQSEIHIAAPQPAIRELLDVTRLTKLFPVHDSVEHAMASA